MNIKATLFASIIIAVGGGNYNMYENKPIIKDIQIEGAQLLINYLSTNDLSHIPKVVNFKVVNERCKLCQNLTFYK